ncbi:hypothetical protein [Urechidicola croceus]|uniref:Bulb-type lectin domain-containing protein n=1 Tax=Urechidicola croceus TaxID=1850246 RepID=A0A1D8P9S3_9FLAO|nr:hypothetical protein [Urechidicola croceus]AOW21347.1 hypothetical protein LPB138_11940 [Urechidicola croceus]
MRKILFILIAFCLINCSKNDDNPAEVSPQIEFTKTFGGSKNESAQSVIQTTDGGYAVLGFTQSKDGDVLTNESLDYYDYWLLKFDINNDLQWSNLYGGSISEKAYDIAQTQDGGFILIGSSNSTDRDVTSNEGLNDFWVVKTDNSGIIEWEKSYGFSGNDLGYSVTQTSDGGYFVGGTLDVSASNGEGNDRTYSRHAGGDYWGLKLDSSGNKEWRRYFGGTFTDTVYDVIESNEGGFLLVGSSDSEDVDISNNKGSYDFWIVKVNSQGELVWEKSFGGSEIDEARSICKTNDGNYLIVGDSRSNDKDISNSKGAADIWLIKISESGNLIWEKSFGGSSFDAGRHISPTLDNGFIITGSSRSQDFNLETNFGQNDIWVFKINASGDMQWQKSFGGTDIDIAYSAVELNDESIIIVGETSSSDNDITENKGFTDLLITKIKLQ